MSSTLIKVWHSAHDPAWQACSADSVMAYESFST